MPNGVQKDIGDSIAVCNSLGIKYVVVNINKAYNAISSEVDVNLAEKLNWTEGLSNQTSVNLAPRLRMATLYAISQTVKGRVINTSNKSEYMTGYFTRWGDECGDCKPLINLLKSEVVAIGLAIPEIPRYLVEKTPSDGLSGQSDEDRLGFTYDQLDTYFKGGRVSEDIARKIESKVFGTLFKRSPVDEFEPWPMA
jgi:NAD+ synthase